MNVEYELNINDILAFTFRDDDSRPKRRGYKLLRRMTLLAFVIELLAAGTLVLLGNAALPFAVLIGVLALLTIVYYVFSPQLIRKILLKRLLNRYSRGLDKMTGKHRVSIGTDAITDRSDAGESSTTWDAINYVISTDQYLFLGVRFSKTYVVPRRAFTTHGDFKGFVVAAKAYYQAAKKPPL